MLKLQNIPAVYSLIDKEDTGQKVERLLWLPLSEGHVKCLVKLTKHMKTRYCYKEKYSINRLGTSKQYEQGHKSIKVGIIGSKYFTLLV